MRRSSLTKRKVWLHLARYINRTFIPSDRRKLKSCRRRNRQIPARVVQSAERIKRFDSGLSASVLDEKKAVAMHDTKAWNSKQRLMHEKASHSKKLKLCRISDGALSSFRRLTEVQIYSRRVITGKLLVLSRNSTFFLTRLFNSVSTSLRMHKPRWKEHKNMLDKKLASWRTIGLRKIIRRFKKFGMTQTKRKPATLSG